MTTPSTTRRIPTRRKRSGGRSNLGGDAGRLCRLRDSRHDESAGHCPAQAETGGQEQHRVAASGSAAPSRTGVPACPRFPSGGCRWLAQAGFACANAFWFREEKLLTRANPAGASQLRWKIRDRRGRLPTLASSVVRSSGSHEGLVPMPLHESLTTCKFSRCAVFVMTALVILSAAVSAQKNDARQK